MKAVLGVLIVIVLFENALSQAIRCFECLPSHRNEYCMNYNEERKGYQGGSAANCPGYCLKADGLLKLDSDRGEVKFMLATCVNEKNAVALEIEGEDPECDDDADNELNYFFNREVIKKQFSHGVNRMLKSEEKSFKRLPGVVKDSRMCRCDETLCNTAWSVSVNLFLTILSLLVVKSLV